MDFFQSKIFLPKNNCTLKKHCLQDFHKKKITKYYIMLNRLLCNWARNATNLGVSQVTGWEMNDNPIGLLFYGHGYFTTSSHHSYSGETYSPLLSKSLPEPSSFSFFSFSFFFLFFFCFILFCVRVEKENRLKKEKKKGWWVVWSLVTQDGPLAKKWKALK